MGSEKRASGSDGRGRGKERERGLRELTFCPPHLW